MAGGTSVSENAIMFLSARVKAAPLRMLSSSLIVHLIHLIIVF